MPAYSTFLPASYVPQTYPHMDIRFWLRRAKSASLPGIVYCTLTSQGHASSPFSTGITAWPPAAEGSKPSRLRQWQLTPVQRLYGETPDVKADNATLTTLYASIMRIHTHLLDSGQSALPADVLTVMRSRNQAAPTLLEAAEKFMEAARAKVRPSGVPIWTRSGYAPSTVSKFRSRLGLLQEYLLKIRQPHLALAKFTAKHAEGLVELIMRRPDAKPGRIAGRGRGVGQEDYAGKVVGLVSQVLDYAVNQEWLDYNPLASYTPPSGFDKPLVYLFPEQVMQLEAYAFGSEYLQRCADSFLFSCWTGLAWTDLDSFNAEQHISEGWLEMLRHKTGTGFALPILPGAARLLTRYAAVPGGLPRYENQPLNRALKQIAAMLGWQMELTHHVARRTFGMFLLNEDVPIETVSSFLGHRNIRTTQKHYSRFLERRKVARDMGQLQRRLAEAGRIS